MTELCDRSAEALAAGLASGEFSATEVSESCLERIDAVDDRVDAFLTPTP